MHNISDLPIIEVFDVNRHFTDNRQKESSKFIKNLKVSRITTICFTF
jgi:hypothetical protein